HLHFELRDSKTEETINPQLFGLKIPDNVKPVISGLYMYRLNGQPFSENTPSQYFQLSGSNGNYSLNKSPIINFNGQVGFGIVTHDQQLPGGNKNGVYSTELRMDGQTIFSSVLERFSFENSRGINSHIDYPALLSYRRTVQKSFKEPGNPLKIYRTNINNGVIELTDDNVHAMQYIVKDVKGNTSYLSFRIKRNPQSVISLKQAEGVKLFSYADSNEYKTDQMRVVLPKGTLYSDIKFNYGISKQLSTGHSAIHSIHTRIIPVHSNYSLWIKPDNALPQNLYNKAVIVDTRGVYQGGTVENGFIKASPRTFGSFYIKLDTVAPVIRPLNISDGKSMEGISKISLKLSDNLSGIRSFRGTIDGQWVLFEYDLKTATLWHTFEGNLSKGKHLFQFVATDMKMNTQTYNATFYR
ncbi:MAG: M23 family peptidase, partial [Sphingobacteriaceae bacterium]